MLISFFFKRSRPFVPLSHRRRIHQIKQSRRQSLAEAESGRMRTPRDVNISVTSQNWVAGMTCDSEVKTEEEMEQGM